MVSLGFCEAMESPQGCLGLWGRENTPEKQEWSHSNNIVHLSRITTQNVLFSLPVRMQVSWVLKS